MPELRREKAVEETRKDYETIQQNATDSTERLKVANGYIYRISVDGKPVIAFYVADRLEREAST